MSIKEFVANLSMDQLAFCAEEAETRLRTLQEGEKVRLWIVAVDNVNRFASPEQLEALEWLKSFICHRLASGKLDRIAVHQMSVYPSEVNEWREVNNDKPEDV